MKTLVVQHLQDQEPGRFKIVRPSPFKETKPVAVKSPIGFPVKDTPALDLRRGLQWYLEQFLDYPYPPETELAERIKDSLRDWGRQAFDALFSARDAQELLHDACPGNSYTSLHLQISSDDPVVLSWPWEALEDGRSGLLALQSHIERRLNAQIDPPALSPDLPQDSINILLVTARPFERDVRYRSISRPLVELIRSKRLPAKVTVLRPPTLDQLRDHLRDHPAHYHILHFDGHGAYETNDQAGHAGLAFRATGQIVFEDKDGKPSPVDAADLSNLLRNYAVPVVVLNACQSAMTDENADDPYASVAAGLLKAGMRSVVAMSYSLYVRGAQEFLPAFYRVLAEKGSVTEAVRAGREEMYARPERVTGRGLFPLRDWLVPVVYQQEAFDFSFASATKTPQTTTESKLPPEARDTRNPYGFIGRDAAIREMERAFLRPPAAILIQGMGGVGKTTLARGFVEWLEATDGIGIGCFWFHFGDIRSAEYVINRMGESFFGTDFTAADMKVKLDNLSRILRENRCVIIWDNFEVARGIPGTSVSANLAEEDRELLRDFLSRLRDGQTKVIITSRTDEDWLDHTCCFRLPLGGLDGEERWEFCESILRDLGLTPDRSNVAVLELMKLLDGHPLSMRAILPKLASMPASQIVAAVRSNLDTLDLPKDEVNDKLAATLRFIEDGVPERQKALLIPLALHDGHVDADFLEAMAKSASAEITRADIDELFRSLVYSGLFRDLGNAIYEMYPPLTGYLRARRPDHYVGGRSRTWEGEFVRLYAAFAQELAPRELHEQRIPLVVHGANLHTAMSLAREHELVDEESAIVQAIGAYAQNTRDFGAAERASGHLLELRTRAGDEEGAAISYHQLGVIAHWRRDFAVAEAWYKKSLAITEKQGNEHGAATTYHQLGRIAEERRDFAAAEAWYKKSLAIEEKQGNERGAAITCHQLGVIAQLRRDLVAAEAWYRRSLAVFEKQGDDSNAASTYHQLGSIAQERRDFAAAEAWYKKSLAIEERQGNEHGAAITYHQLGRVAEERRDFIAAEAWYKKSLEIKEKQDNEHGAAITYHQLGRVAEERRDFIAAEAWYKKSLEIKEKQGDEHGAAITYHQLGSVSQERREYAAAETWYKKALAIFEKQGDGHAAAMTLGQLGVMESARGEAIAAARHMIASIRGLSGASDGPNAVKSVSNLSLIRDEADEGTRRAIDELIERAGLSEAVNAINQAKSVREEGRS